MNIEQLRNYCLNKQNVEECFPFDEETLVYKVNGKMFLLASLEKQPLSFNVKCDPEKAMELREKYTCVQPGYHMNKKYWNTIVVDGSITIKELFTFIDDSYELVAAGKKKTLSPQKKTGLKSKS